MVSNFQKLQIFISNTDQLFSDIKKMEKQLEQPLLVSNEPKEKLPFEFDEKHLANAEKMAEIYKQIFCFENDLRDKIRAVVKKDAASWLKVPRDVTTKIEQRKTDEQSAVILIRSEEDDLVYATLPELKKIIQDNWSDFEGLFRDSKFIQQIINEINDRRIVVAHNSLLKDLDIQRLINSLAYYGNPEQ